MTPQNEKVIMEWSDQALADVINERTRSISALRKKIRRFENEAGRQRERLITYQVERERRRREKANDVRNSP